MRDAPSDTYTRDMAEKARKEAEIGRAVTELLAGRPRKPAAWWRAGIADALASAPQVETPLRKSCGTDRP